MWLYFNLAGINQENKLNR